MKRRQDREAVMSDTPKGRTGIRDRARESISSKNLHLHGSNCRIVLIHPDDIDTVWESILPYMEEVVSHSQGEATSDHYYEELSSGSMQLWAAVEEEELLACMVTQIAPYPNKKVMRIIALGGVEMDKWIQFLPDVEHWASSVGCTALEAWGRKGWLKILKDWECSYHILTKEIKGRMH